MEMKYFLCYHSYLHSTEMLDDAEFGRLMRACIAYSETGKETELKGNERFLFPMIQQQIDSGKESYEAKCKKNRENIAIRWNTNVYDRIPNDTNHTKENKKENKKENENKKESVKKEVADAPFPDSFSPQLCDAIKSWLTYKRERKETYKSEGQRALISQIENKLSDYREKDIIALIKESMANGYQGIIWENLKDKKPKSQRHKEEDLPI